MNKLRIPQFSMEKAHKTQLRLSKKIILRDMLPEKINFIAGVDVAYTKDKAIGAVAVLEYESLKLMESQTSICKLLFPYIPTLLSFRETPPAIKCIKKLTVQPDLFLVDGHGIAHPYRCGFASHLGLLIGKPTIGVAKNKLVGEIEAKGKEIALIKSENDVVGAMVITKQGRKPIYVSVGHKVSLERAIEIVLHCIKDDRIPEPILTAHRIATAEKRKLNNKTKLTK